MGVHSRPLTFTYINRWVADPTIGALELAQMAGGSAKPELGNPGSALYLRVPFESGLDQVSVPGISLKYNFHYFAIT